MAVSLTRTWRSHRARLLAATTVVVVAIAALLIATQDGASDRLPVFLVLSHTTIRAGESDTVVTVNKTGYDLNTGGVSITPRTDASFFTTGRAMAFDDPRNYVPAYSRRRLLQQGSLALDPPGRYWVWMAYAAGDDTTRYAIAKLTIVAR